MNTSEIDRLAALCDAANEQWMQEHRNDPCVRCGTREGVQLLARGSLGRVRPLCSRCDEIRFAEFKALTEGVALAKREYAKLSLTAKIKLAFRREPDWWP